MAEPLERTADWPSEAVEELERLRERTAQLAYALESRIVIEQAKGVLIERFRLDPDRAFAVLRRAARSRRLNLHELAHSVVGSRTTPVAIAREVARLDGKEELR